MDFKCNRLIVSFVAASVALSAWSAPTVDNTMLDRARECMLNYDIDGARSNLTKFKQQFGKGRGKINTPVPEAADELSDRIDRVEQMLGNVQHIEIIDSMIVDKADFFDHYNLSPSAGTLSAATSIPECVGAAAGDVAYLSPDGYTLIWSAKADNGLYTLTSANRLLDDSWEAPIWLPGELNGGGDNSFTFLMPDGYTLYYATNGDASIGGLDIMMSRFDGQRWLEPQNVGMPFNSPANDYMMAYDEDQGIGWWATDRRQDGDKVVIYTFVIPQLRENYPDDTPGLVSLARVESIDATWSDPQQRQVWLNRLKQHAEASPAQKAATEFHLHIGKGTIYTCLDNFRSPEARAAMEDCLILSDEMRVNRDDLAKLRQRYASGDPSDHDDILTMENLIRQQQQELTRLRNLVITLETNR